MTFTVDVARGVIAEIDAGRLTWDRAVTDSRVPLTLSEEMVRKAIAERVWESFRKSLPPGWIHPLAQSSQQSNRAKAFLDPHAGGHDFGPTLYDLADFTPVKRCRTCKAQFKCRDIQAGSIPACAQTLSRGSPGSITSGPFAQDFEISPSTDRPADTGAISKCECGAHRACGVGRSQSGHSEWCPWAP